MRQKTAEPERGFRNQAGLRDLPEGRQIDDEALGAAIAGLAHSDSSIRRKAAGGLAAAGPRAARAMDRLTRMLEQEKGFSSKAAAARALVAIDSPASVGVVLDRVLSSKPDTSKSTMRALKLSLRELSPQHAFSLVNRPAVDRFKVGEVLDASGPHDLDIILYFINRRDFESALRYSGTREAVALTLALAPQNTPKLQEEDRSVCLDLLHKAKARLPDKPDYARLLRLIVERLTSL